MKKKKSLNLQKKLSLNKKTIASMNESLLWQVQGGTAVDCDTKDHCSGQYSCACMTQTNCITHCATC